jgi:hypothetical protein
VSDHISNEPARLQEDICIKDWGNCQKSKMKTYAFEIPLIAALIKLMLPMECTFK